MPVHRKLKNEELDRINAEEYGRSEKHPVIVVLENIRSAYNVGSIFRTADAFRIDSLYLCGYTAYPPHKEIEKTALGASASVNWKHFTSSAAAIAELRQREFGIFAVEQATESIPLSRFNEKRSRIALLFGNEVSGLDQETIDLC
jgi:23S rRNA (guanosine2251-2'-O)-methyltransferase